MRLSALLAACILLTIGCATTPPPHGSPTPVDQTLTWNDYTDPDGIGFFMYWALESETLPRQYTDTRKVDLSRPDPETIIVKDVMPAKGSLCFKLTAYDAASNESDWSNEDCGFFGLTGASGLLVGP